MEIGSDNELEDRPNSEAELHKYWQEVLRKNKSQVDKRLQGDKCNSIVKDKLKFARIYSELIHSGKYTKKLIDLEFSYWPALKDMFQTRNSSVDELDNKNTKEIEEAMAQLGFGHTEESISSLTSGHCQDMERLMNNWNMSIEALKDAQREDFCEKLESLWDEYNNRSSNNSTMFKISELNNKSKLDDIYTIDSDASEPINPIKLEESFTINLGSQLKTTHNLRILAVDSLYLFDILRNRSSQVRTQTAMSLYSHNLSAVVMLVGHRFKIYHGTQYEFSKLCTSLNEFHLDNFDKQIKHIKEVLPIYAGRNNLETGDCYVTKHSNLATAHIVFHLVHDESLVYEEVNSRHAIFASLRNILRVAHMYDIKTISIPLMLVDDMYEEYLSVNWCMKRAELVLKCVKGFLIEMASLSTGVEQGTIQFLVPKGISEELFSSLAALIPDVFRLSNSVVLKSS